MTTEITTSQPVVIPATQAQTYDKLWVENLNINGRSLDTAPVTAIIVCRPYTTDGAGAKAFAPVTAIRRITVPDVFASAATNTALATALDAVLTAVQALVTEDDTPEAN